MISSPAELKAFLAALGIKPNQRLSQNFLIDGNIIDKLLREADVRPGERVLEIGPGPGAITEKLLACGAHVLAVEKDRILAEALRRYEDVEVFAEDILTFPLEKIGVGKVVANLPFQLTSPILGLLAPRHDLFSTLTLIVQEEVARRMVAKAGERERSSLSVFLEFYTEACYAFRVSRRCFYPAPAVDSAVVSLKLRPPQNIDADRFFALVHTAFQQRRKMLRASLKTYGFAEDALMQMRPEQLTLEQWMNLYQRIS